MQDPALFRCFPTLRQKLAWHPFLEGPTPVTSMPLKGAPEGLVWVKHDDRSCSLYGGNKPRKLEFVIGQALRRRSGRLVTSGGLGTHHGLATAILGYSVGLDTTLVLVHQPITSEVVRSLEHFCAWGAELVYARTPAAAALQSLRVLAGSALRGERPYLVWPGGSSALGNLGFVSGALELAEQVAEGAAPEPAEIWLPVGTGGTLVGLVVGLKLAGISTRVRGVVVTDLMVPTRRSLCRQARVLVQLLRRCDPSIPRLRIEEADFLLDTRQLGPGYGAETEAAREALGAARDCGIELETTYTAKCLAALQVSLRESPTASGVRLFWNTFNGSRIPAPPPEVSPSVIPPEIRHVIGAP